MINNRQEQIYRIIRELGGTRHQLYLPVLGMRAGDTIIVAEPPFKSLKLTEIPNGELVGRTLPDVILGTKGGVVKRIPTEDITSDEQGRVISGDYSTDRGSHISTPGDGIHRSEM